jgi:hypothetical protein
MKKRPVVPGCRVREGMAPEVKTHEDDREIVSIFRERKLPIRFRQDGARIIRADMVQQTVSAQKG